MKTDNLKYHLNQFDSVIYRAYKRLVHQYLMDWKTHIHAGYPVEVEDLLTKVKYHYFADDFLNNRKMYWDHYYQRMLRFIEECWGYAESTQKKYGLNKKEYITQVREKISKKLREIHRSAIETDAGIMTLILSNRKSSNPLDLTQEQQETINHFAFKGIYEHHIKKCHDEKYKFLLGTDEPEEGIKNNTPKSISKETVTSNLQTYLNITLEKLTPQMVYRYFAEQGAILTYSKLDDNLKQISDGKCSSLDKKLLPDNVLKLSKEECVFLVDYGAGCNSCQIVVLTEDKFFYLPSIRLKLSSFKNYWTELRKGEKVS